MLSVDCMDTLNKYSKMIYIYTYTHIYDEKSERDQMCFINYTWLILVKANFFSSVIFYFYYPKHENIFKEPVYTPKNEESVSTRIYCKGKAKNNLQFFTWF